MELNQYQSLSELETNFNVEYINNCYDFCRLIHQIPQEKDTIYRGVSSARYKMYCSAQRFYHDYKINEDGLDYSSFIKRLYEISPIIDNGHLLNLYEDVQHDNWIQYVNADKEFKSEKLLFDYNPIWVFHTLQHLTECSPFLDFSDDFFVALYFASQGILPLTNKIDQKIDNYIEIISIDENKIYNTNDNHSVNNEVKYNSLVKETLNDPVKMDFQSPIFMYDDKSIKYICFSGFNKLLGGRDFEYNFSFVNDNCLAQSSRLYLTSSQFDKPFEDLWNSIFNYSHKLKVYLIHKTLVDEIFRYLTTRFLGKIIVPIQKNYKPEILQLIKK